jgi:hypothetical protein
MSWECQGCKTLIGPGAWRSTKIAAIAILFVIVGCSAYWLGGRGATVPTQQVQPKSQELNLSQKVAAGGKPEALKDEQVSSFNVTEKSFALNGNLKAAVDRLRSTTPDSIWAAANDSQVSKITLSPYSFLGKPIRLSGTVYKIEQFAPEDSLGGTWYEVLITVQNSNSPLGATTVDFIYNGDGAAIDPQSNLTCAGYFIGMAEGPNALGGQVDIVVLAGNVVKQRNAVMKESNANHHPPLTSCQNTVKPKTAFKLQHPQRPSPMQVIERLRNN